MEELSWDQLKKTIVDVLQNIEMAIVSVYR